LIVPAEPFHWHALLADDGQANRAHLHGRLTALQRMFLCIACEPLHYVDGADAAVLSALAAVEILGDGHGPVRTLRLLAGLEALQTAMILQRRQAVALAEPPSPPGTHLSEDLHLRCRDAVDLHKFALGVYTGVLLDCGRYLCPCMAWMAWLRDQCCGAGGSPPGRGTLYLANATATPVKGDNCWHGHRNSFERYVGKSDAQLLAARRHSKPCEVSFYVVLRPEEKQLVVAICGSEQTSDVLTDTMMTPQSLEAADLGLGASATTGGAPLGHAFAGVLASARALASEVLPVLTDALGGQYAGYAVHAVGHSLGATTAALFALRAREQLLSCGASTVHATCFSPMPCLSRAALDAIGDVINRETVLSIVFRDDFASRLSLRRLKRLRVRAAAAADRRSQLGGFMAALRAARLLMCLGCRCLLRAGQYVGSTETRGRARAVNMRDSSTVESAGPKAAWGAGVDEEAVQLGVEGDDDIPELYLAGSVVHVRGKPGSMEVASVAAASFAEMEVTPTVLLDHVPWMLQYELAKSLGCSFERHGCDWAKAATSRTRLSDGEQDRG
jgi:pimeloyl-ACP methyl ester carboxylesterase